MLLSRVRFAVGTVIVAGAFATVAGGCGQILGLDDPKAAADAAGGGDGAGNADSSGGGETGMPDAANERDGMPGALDADADAPRDADSGDADADASDALPPLCTLGSAMLGNCRLQ